MQFNKVFLIVLFSLVGVLGFVYLVSFASLNSPGGSGLTGAVVGLQQEYLGIADLGGSTPTLIDGFTSLNETRWSNLTTGNVTWEIVGNQLISKTNVTTTIDQSISLFTLQEALVDKSFNATI